MQMKSKVSLCVVASWFCCRFE